MSDLIQDVLDVAQGLKIEPRHSLVFKTLQDINGTLFDSVSILRAVDTKDIAALDDAIDGAATNDLSETAVGFSRVSAVRSWSADLKELANTFDTLSGGNSTVADLNTAAKGVSAVYSPYPETHLVDLGFAFSRLEGASNKTTDILSTGQAVTRTSNIIFADAQDISDTLSNATGQQTAGALSKDIAHGFSAVSSQSIFNNTSIDIGKSFSQVSGYHEIRADLKENAFVFSAVDSTATAVLPETVSNVDSIAKPVFKTDSGWTCNTHTFAMSMYTGNLTSNEFTGIVTTGRSNFESQKTKRVSRAYFELTCEQPATFIAQADGRGTVQTTSYEVRAPECKVGPETQRLKLGRGAVGDRWAFQFECAAPFVLQNFNVLVSEGVISHG